ncbi:DoxX family protein [Psychrosphaera sp. B3R10]|uniref:DoxX family protein n=1 Tax=Psychrosphaera algicola TaxID=3023714 RepID=A0ABT5F8G9_9GAMM|nr:MULTISPECIES: DoxX family protein [unclassified Psychrosphaera]MBU2882232.1 DoxX family protein [Psychrosphaera sp. I2R16]MBU2988913.1 DoxX family protein [Psychrosphaera sp. B3R10]MDC2887836.1 DoxX family protein [Psychrosphaera sp. G1-22]MDO6717933.1 DoxX family protein [Psychrosphaera sp. 1_MG-2023]
MYSTYKNFVERLSLADGLPLLFIRLYLAPVLIQAGWTKFQAFDQTSAWFGNNEWGLGLPFPDLMASLAISAELLGGIFILFGLLTRLTSIPLLITMFVAAKTAHWQNGWLAIADPSSWLADGTLFLNEQIMASVEKKQKAIEIIQEHGHYDWLSSSGSFVILNNGIEFAATYFIMLLVLLVFGGGKYTSIDHYLTGLVDKTKS